MQCPRGTALQGSSCRCTTLGCRVRPGRRRLPRPVRWSLLRSSVDFLRARQQVCQPADCCRAMHEVAMAHEACHAGWRWRAAGSWPCSQAQPRALCTPGSSTRPSTARWPAGSGSTRSRHASVFTRAWVHACAACRAVGISVVGVLQASLPGSAEPSPSTAAEEYECMDYSNGGPAFHYDGSWPDKRLRLLASYVDLPQRSCRHSHPGEQPAAAVACEVGAGIAVLCGTHPELGPEWLTGNGQGAGRLSDWGQRATVAAALTEGAGPRQLFCCRSAAWGPTCNRCLHECGLDFWIA